MDTQNDRTDRTPGLGAIDSRADRRRNSQTIVESALPATLTVMRVLRVVRVLQAPSALGACALNHP